jgi:hypothetical protein
MIEQQIKATVACLMILSIGLSGSLQASQLNITQPPSENCAEASKAVSRILCEQESSHEDVLEVWTETKVSSTTKPIPKRENKEPARNPTPSKKQASTKPKRTAGAKKDKLHRNGRNHFVASDKAHSKNTRTRRKKNANNHHKKTANAHHPVRVKPHATKDKRSGNHSVDIKKTNRRAQGNGERKSDRTRRAPSSIELEDFFLGRKLHELSRAERKILRRSLEALLERKVTIAFLNSLQKCEGGDVLMIVGGSKRKSVDCQRRIAKLDLSGHPKDQGLPDRCFLTTRHGLSTASGCYQIVYYRNWKRLKRPLGLSNFYPKEQAIAALELVRTSATRNGNVGEGLVALLRNDLDQAIRKGTDPWACSPHSRWRGRHSPPLLRYAQKELRKLENKSYARNQFRRFQSNSDS